MGLKHVELQIAIPRTQDMGKRQHDIQQRGQVAQDNITSSLQHAHRQNEHKVTSRNTLFNLEPNSAGSGTKTYTKNSDKRAKQSHPKEQHPHKGHTIDYSG